MTFMKDLEEYDELADQESLLFKLVTSKFFSGLGEDEVQEMPAEEIELDIQTVLVFGLLYCKGSIHIKSTVFYRVLQEDFNDQIAAGDKDLKKLFPLVLNLASLQVHQWAE